MTKKGFYICLFIFLFAAYFPLFLHLDTLSLRIFDESRVGMNAMEMAERGNWLVPHYGGKPDMWNLKPPLMVWLEALSMKALGYNTLAVRLPSAFAGLATILFLLWFGIKILKDRMVGFASALVLLTTPGFVAIHVTRTGEYDALLCLFLLAYALTFFRWLHAPPEQQKKLLWYFGLFFTLSLLTKGIAGLFFLPGLALYAFTQRKLWWMLRQPNLYLVGLGSIAIILAYYFGRELINPGYLQAVWDNELGGRFGGVIEGHRHPFMYYIKRTISWQFAPWIYFIPLSFLLGWWSRKREVISNLSWFLLLNSGLFLLIISFSQTKLGWYNVPAFPLMALLVGLGIARLREAVTGLYTQPIGSVRSVILGAAFLFCFFAYPYYKIVEKSYLPVDKEWNKESMRFEPYFERTKGMGPYKVISSGYNSHLEFHVQARKLLGEEVPILTPEVQYINPGDLLMVCEPRIFKKINQLFHHETEHQWTSCKLIRITSLRSDQ